MQARKTLEGLDTSSGRPSGKTGRISEAWRGQDLDFRLVLAESPRLLTSTHSVLTKDFWIQRLREAAWGDHRGQSSMVR